MAVERRKSSRRQNTSEATMTQQQSRITEFVSVKKRTHNGLVSNKNLINKVSSETEATSQMSTPVKIKRKTQIIQPQQNETKIKCGLLTPSQSTDSMDINEAEVNDVKNEKLRSIDSSSLISTSVKGEVILHEKEESLPAYKRFAHLVENITDHSSAVSSSEEEVPVVEPISSASTLPSTPATLHHSQSDSISNFSYIPWLPLSEKWLFYEKVMFNVDSMCALSAGRSQPCIFHKIQKSLENILGRTVPIEQLERIKTLWPEAYEFRGTKVILQGKRVDSVAITVPETQDANNKEVVLSSAKRSNDRKEEIKCRVQKYVMKAHESFIKKKLNLNTIPKDVQLKQWHPEFDQERCAEIPRTGLLSQTTSTEHEPESSLINTPVKVPILIDQVIKSSLPSTPVKREQNIKDSQSEVILKGITTATESSHSEPKKQLSLLERIRAKEQKLQTERLFHSESGKDRVVLNQLEKFAQSVSFSFASSKKTSLFLTDLTKKLVQSSLIPISSVEVEERLKLLQKYVPGWLLIVEEPGNPKYIKLTENFSLNRIIEKLNEQYK